MTAPPVAHIRRYCAEMAIRTIGERLIRMREAAGLSQSELARLARVARNTVIRIEAGHPISPTLRTLEKLARACSRPVTELTEDAFSVAPLDASIDELIRLESLRPVINPTEDEIEWLRRLPPALWRELKPSAEVLSRLIEAERAARKIDR